VGFSHHANPAADSLPFEFLGEEPLPPARVVIGAFPLARQLQGASDAQIGDAVARYVRRCGEAQIVQLSTDAVYSGARGERGEEHAPDPRTPYGRAQAAVDAALAKQAPRSLIVRTSFIFGWAGGRLDKRLAPFADQLAQAEAQSWPVNIFRSPTEVNFLAAGICAAVDRGVVGILNIAGPRMSIADFFGAALAPFGSFRRPPPFVETDPAVARDTSLCAERMKVLLGLSPDGGWEWYLRCSTSLGEGSTIDVSASAKSRTPPAS
jgi:dTDP-4-dehydrorhamnose reductase